ncbi:MAG: hypothetical protein KGQ36_02185 [Rickettsiales bacterium]|nr:hypothetical protein [Rickettsiales bacterium]
MVIKDAEKRKELYDALLIDVFGSGKEDWISAFDCSGKVAEYVPDYTFTDKDGFDIVKSSILGGNPNIFKIACERVGFDNIRDKESAFKFASENGVDYIKDILSEELDKIVKANQEALIKELKKEEGEPKTSKAKAKKLKSVAKKERKNEEESSNDKMDFTEKQNGNTSDYDKQDFAVEINGSNSVEEKIKEAIQEEKIITTLEEVSLNLPYKDFVEVEQIKYDDFDLDSMRKESLEEFCNALSERLEEEQEQELKNIKDLCSELMKKDGGNDKMKLENIEVKKKSIVSDLNVDADVFVPLSKRNNSSGEKPSPQVPPSSHKKVLASERSKENGGKEG